MRVKHQVSLCFCTCHANVDQTCGFRQLLTGPISGAWKYAVLHTHHNSGPKPYPFELWSIIRLIWSEFLACLPKISALKSCSVFPWITASKIRESIDLVGQAQLAGGEILRQLSH